MKRFLILPLLVSFLFSEETTELKEGHSHQGHAFNEGPRQASPLINPLSPPCIPPKFVLHGLPAKSKFLAVPGIHAGRPGGIL